MATALSIPGYDLIKQLHEGANTLIYRGICKTTQAPVILKILKADHPSPEQIARLKHEYRVTAALKLLGVVQAQRLEIHHNRLVLVAEDFGGQSLKLLLHKRSLSLAETLNIAVQLAQALASLHQHQIIHKDIKPDNIIINPTTHEVRLTDFSIAARSDQETAQTLSPNQLEGTLAYLSPEQTGRMNRAIDHRSDFYSLGVTLYELLTGQLPFCTTDPLEWVHCHIAKQPKPLQRLNPAIPQAIAAVVMKLMAKNAEDRYQSAAGLLVDLEFCRNRLESGSFGSFVPGLSDRASQFCISQRRYGREQEIEQLLAAFDRISQGKSELMLVSGYSGIGKSSLINEVHKPIVRQRGYFIAGKFDQFKRNTPYAPLIQAFQSLMQQLLTEDADRLRHWQEQLQTALGSNAQVIVEVIPDVELIIGKQPPVAALKGTEAQNRLNRLFQAFIRVFTQRSHPLVLFLDDLQWVDSASLNLIQALMTQLDSQYLLLIGAYRDNEVNPSHPLIKTLEEIEQATSKTVGINRLALRPLELAPVQQLVADTLGATETGQSLAELLFYKTQGNPLFLTQLLKTLYLENFLTFNFASGLWQWDITQIQATGITDKNVVDLVAGNIEKLPPTTQMILKLAACVGDRFSLSVLAAVSESSARQVAEALQPALQTGLILPLTRSYKIHLLFGDEAIEELQLDDQIFYRFLHDRVQQATYSLIPEDQKQATHLAIGQLLRHRLSLNAADGASENSDSQGSDSQGIDSHIFNIVNQFNIGAELLTEPAARTELAHLNLRAAQKAKAAAAYAAALRYVEVGVALLAAEAWQTNYELSLALYEQAIDSAYSLGKFEQVEQDSEVMLKQAKTPLDIVKAYELRILVCLAQQNLSGAVNWGLQALERFDLHLPMMPTQAKVEQALQETAALVNQQGIEQLAGLPAMVDPHSLAIMQILNTFSPAAFLASPSLFLLIVAAQIKLSILQGNSPLSAVGYAQYGIVLCNRLNQIELGSQLGQLALHLANQSNHQLLKTKVFLVVGLFITHWRSHLKESVALFRLGCQSGVECGNLDDTACHYYFDSQFAYFAGQELESLDRKAELHQQAIQQLKQGLLLNDISRLRQVILNLRGEAADPCKLAGVAYCEEQDSPGSRSTKSQYSIYLHKLILCYLFGDAAALENARLATSCIHPLTLQPVAKVFYWYDSLIHLDQFHQMAKPEQQQALQRVAENQNRLWQWAGHAPMNFLHKIYLVEAEKHRVMGETLEAMDLYDRAIAAAAENGYIQEEALANERAALFYLESGKPKIARIYFTDAYYGYIRWGALAKINDLDRRYPNLIMRSQIGDVDPTGTIAESVSMRTGTTTSGTVLDLATVIKATEAMTSEIVLETLLKKLLKIILENAAAQTGCLILERKQHLFIEVANFDQDESEITLNLVPIETSCNVPLSLIHYVARTQQPLILNNVLQDHRFNADPYVLDRQPQSVLCAPMQYQGELIGLVYLENNLVTQAFTSDRLELLKVLTSQAAIAIENAKLYQQSQIYARDLEQALQGLKQMQLQLVQSEKLSTLGNLVAGVAHEINNPIGFLNGSLNNAKDFIQDILEHLQRYQTHYPQSVADIQDHADKIDLNFLTADLPKMIASMKAAIDRICNISTSLRTFSRADTESKVACNLQEGIDSTLLILKYRLRANSLRPAIEVVTCYGDLPQVHCYPGQLNQVFMNILANAIDVFDEMSQALPFDELQTHPQRIEITTEILPEAIAIQIQDNGAGMSEVVKARIFDHLFTTKAVGRGTGLGLAIARQIVEEIHGGRLSCISAPGEGTAFTIEMPNLS